eukprot:Rhum_TRINITY_DN20841_c0_g1::Rhum_TRINITY_DN20841_c0_g1_i1::g.172213::m.172213/K01136/IDS; iduronate 2-sulfatase
MMQLCVLLLAAAAAECAATPYNVLLLVVDDLRPDIAINYNQTYVKTPHIDALIQEGTSFHRAYAQQAICGPTRNSFLSGRRPQHTQCWNFLNSFRDVGPDWIPLPEHFKKKNYTTLGSGKVYHENLPPNYDEPKSWSQDRPFVNLRDKVQCADHGFVCGVNASYGDFTDYRNVQSALSNLRYAVAKKQEHGNPFFIAYGAHKPHEPFLVPQDFYDLYDSDDVALPLHEAAPTGMPPIAFTYEIDGMSEIHVNGTLYKTPFPAADTAFPDNVTRELRHGYYSAVSWTDYNVGLLLQELDTLGVANETVVALIGDHGWQLGEHNVWGKHTNFELATRVPLVFKAPGKPGGQVAEALVESVDLYPTLASLAGLDIPAGLDGTDLTPFMDDPAATGRNVAFSEYPRCPKNVSEPWTDTTSCTRTKKADFTVMGYSVRVPDYRYTVWLHWDGAKLVGDFARRPIAEELYLHLHDTENDFDAFENINRASDPAHAATVATLYAMAVAQWQKV